jgi:hypothetical protein
VHMQRVMCRQQRCVLNSMKRSIPLPRCIVHARSFTVITHLQVAMLEAPSRNICAKPCSRGCTFATPISTIIVTLQQDSSVAPLASVHQALLVSHQLVPPMLPTCFHCCRRDGAYPSGLCIYNRANVCPSALACHFMKGVVIACSNSNRTNACSCNGLLIKLPWHVQGAPWLRIRLHQQLSRDKIRMVSLRRCLATRVCV